MMHSNIVLKPFDPESDREQLYAWLNAEHVKNWWGDPGRALNEVLRPTKSGARFIIQASGVDVGYIQWGRATQQEIDEAGLTELVAGFPYMDILIGDPGLVGQGIGPAAIACLLDRLFNEESFQEIGLGTSVNNHSAIKSYEKVGFTKGRQYDDPEIGKAWLMVATKSSFDTTTRIEP